MSEDTRTQLQFKTTESQTMSDSFYFSASYEPIVLTEKEHDSASSWVIDE